MSDAESRKPPMVVRSPYGHGIYRRRILLRAGRAVATADLEDDFHRFQVTITHDGSVVTNVTAHATRYPWSTCPSADEPLRALIGMALSPRSTAVADRAEPRANCMHMFDLAGLAIAHAARAPAVRGARLYDVAIPDRIEGRTTPALWRDGAPLLAWSVEHHRIIEPDPFRGLDLTRGSAFLAWCEERLDPDLGEAAIVLRRGMIISLGRLQDLDRIPTAAAMLPIVKGTCFTFTEGVAEGATRIVGATHDLTDTPDALLADLD